MAHFLTSGVKQLILSCPIPVTLAEWRKAFKASQTNRSWHDSHDEKFGPLSLVSRVLKQIKLLQVWFGGRMRSSVLTTDFTSYSLVAQVVLCFRYSALSSRSRLPNETSGSGPWSRGRIWARGHLKGLREFIIKKKKPWPQTIENNTILSSRLTESSELSQFTVQGTDLGIRLRSHTFDAISHDSSVRRYISFPVLLIAASLHGSPKGISCLASFAFDWIGCVILLSWMG